MVTGDQYLSLKYHIEYLNILTMETIPDSELKKAKELILLHHNLFIKLYFSLEETAHKTFINILY